MKTTLSQALEIAKAGNWNKAWEIAQQDEGLLPEVTKAQWIGFAEKTLAQLEAEATNRLEGWD